MNAPRIITVTVSLLAVVATIILTLNALSGDERAAAQSEATDTAIPVTTPTAPDAGGGGAGGGPTATSTATPTDTPTATAVAKVIASAPDLIDGPISRGVLGDFLLANEEIQVVIQQPQRNLIALGQYGGQIIDADLVREGADPERDAFEEWAFGINLENTCHYTKINVINDGTDGNPAVIRATGVDDLLDWINPSSQVADFGFPFPAAFDDTDLDVTCSTDYKLALGNKYVEVETTITNTGGTEIETFLTEFLSVAGSVEPFHPGYGFGEPLVTGTCALCNFIAWGGNSEAAGVSYGYIHNIDLDAADGDETTSFNTSGVTIPLLDDSAALALTGLAGPNVTIPASGGTVSVTRYFAVGDGDVGAIVDIRNDILGLSTGTISGTVTRGGSPVEGADVTVLGSQASGPGSDKNVVSHYLTDANGDYSGTLPPDDYTVQAHVEGHMPASPDPANVTITASTTTVQDFTIPEAARLKVTIVDESNAAIAGKVSLIGFDQYPDPGNFQNFLGFVDINTELFGFTADALPYGVARVLFVDDAGDSGEVFIEPGSYRVVVSHGTEYSVCTQDVTLTGGNLTTVDCQIALVIDTTGFVSGDFHIHQIHSPDSKVTLEERVISTLGEGLDFFTPSDHEHRTDISSAITDLGVGGLVAAAPSAENTTPDYGHFIAWPMTIDPNQANGGALDWPGAAPAGEDFPSFGNYMLSPGEIYDALLADPGVDTVQINHIDTFFGPAPDGLAIDTGMTPPQDFANRAAKRLDPSIPNLFDDSFTALESWQGTDLNNINRFITRNLGDWFNMLNQGIVRSSVATSDTHKRIQDQSGFPRTLIASSTDDPGALVSIVETLATNVNDGRAIGINGPYIEVTSSAASTTQNGGLALGSPTLIETIDGSATISVEIQSPLWAEFDRVEFYINGAQYADDHDGDGSTPPLYRAGPDVIQIAGTDFTVTTVDDFPLIPGAEHYEASTSLDLTGLTEDTWVVVLVRGTDGVSEPIFPVVPNDIDQGSNATVADLSDGNLGEDGVPALAFSNPLFIDVDGNATYDAPGVNTTPTADYDQDGCTNAREQASNEAVGGERDYLNFWDFYDTPNASNVRDKQIDLFNDIFAVALRFSATGDPNGDPLAGPIPAAPAYHTAFDRSAPPAGADAWDLQAADGNIDLFNDIFGVAFQFGHKCS